MTEQLEYGAIDTEARDCIELYLRASWDSSTMDHPDVEADALIRHLWDAGFQITRHNEYHENKFQRDAMLKDLPMFRAEAVK